MSCIKMTSSCLKTSTPDLITMICRSTNASHIGAQKFHVSDGTTANSSDSHKPFRDTQINCSTCNNIKQIKQRSFPGGSVSQDIGPALHSFLKWNSVPHTSNIQSQKANSQNGWMYRPFIPNQKGKNPGFMQYGHSSQSHQSPVWMEVPCSH